MRFLTVEELRSYVFLGGTTEHDGVLEMVGAAAEKAVLDIVAPEAGAQGVLLERCPGELLRERAAPVWLAMMELAATWFAQRDALGAGGGAVPFGIEMKLKPYVMTSGGGSLLEPLLEELGSRGGGELGR